MQGLHTFFGSGQQAGIFRSHYLVHFVQARFYLFGMIQGFGFLFQFGLFSFLKVCIIQLFQLEPDVIFILPALLGLRYEVGQLFAYVPVLGINILVCWKFVVILCQDIQYIQLESLTVEQQVLMLAMYIYQFLAQFLHLRQWGRSIVYECAAFTWCI